jgi:hypothetical protein
MIPLAARDRTHRLTLAVAAAALLAACGAAASDVDPQPVAKAAADSTAKPAADSAGKAAADSVAAAITKKDSALAPQPDPGDVLARMLPPRSDSAYDWYAPLEPLHRCGEPRLLPTCVPPPPCHPALPPHPLDLVGMPGAPTCGPIYHGPCAPRTGSHDNGPHPRIHRVHDRLFDWFYAPRTPIFP